MSSRTKALKQPPIISSTPRKVGRPLGSVPSNKSPSLRPDLVGMRFGSVEITRAEVGWKGKPYPRMYVWVKCLTCPHESAVLFTNLTGGRTKGCSNCNQPKQFPTWLFARVQQQVARCTDPSHESWPSYGGRGIRFNFKSETEACLWIRDNLGIPERSRTTQIDRIDNDGHYEPGNLRWSTQSQNMAHTTAPQRTAKAHLFRTLYPDVRYADSTLRHLVAFLTFDQIVDRFYNLPSCKPKGVYGTFSTPDPVVVSLLKGS